MERLRRERVDEEDRYRSALGKLHELRAAAARLHESAVARSSLLGMLGELLRELAAGLQAMWQPMPEQPQGAGEAVAEDRRADVPDMHRLCHVRGAEVDDEGPWGSCAIEKEMPPPPVPPSEPAPPLRSARGN